MQLRIQEFVGPLLSSPFLSSPLPFPLEAGLLKPAISLGLVSDVSSSAGSGTQLRPKTNLVHSKAARKPLVAIILMFSEMHVLQ